MIFRLSHVIRIPKVLIIRNFGIIYAMTVMVMIS